MGTVHQFSHSLAQGEQHADEPMWERAYRGFFGPLFAAMVRNPGGTVGQYRGIDRHVCLTDGRTVRVDEKRREKDYGDILLEVWSVAEERVPGWIAKDLEIDYLAYAVIPAQRVYVFDFRTLRRVWRDHCRAWWALAKAERRGFSFKDASNRRSNGTTYTTTSITVPVRELLAAYGEACVVDVAASGAA